jgi:hypothetical protein
MKPTKELIERFNAQNIDDILSQLKVDKNGKIWNKGRVNDMLLSLHLRSLESLNGSDVPTKVTQYLKGCDFCNATGFVPETGLSTSVIRTCPVCNGSKVITVTESEFASQPPVEDKTEKDYCSCSFVMIMRDKEDNPRCGKCGLLVKEEMEQSQLVSTKSADEILNELSQKVGLIDFKNAVKHVYLKQWSCTAMIRLVYSAMEEYKSHPDRDKVIEKQDELLSFLYREYGERFMFHHRVLELQSELAALKEGK